MPASASVETQWLKYQSDVEQCPDEKRFCVKENLKIKRIQFALKWTILKRKSSEVPRGPGANGRAAELDTPTTITLCPLFVNIKISDTQTCYFDHSKTQSL